MNEIERRELDTERKIKKAARMASKDRSLHGDVILQSENGEVRILMPFIVSVMRTDMSKIQQDVILSIIERIGGKLRSILTHKELRGRELTLFKDEDFEDDKAHVKMKIPLSEFGVSPAHYPELRSALTMLAQVPVELPVKGKSGTEYVYFTHFCSVYIPKEVRRNQYSIVKMEREVAEQLLRLDMGYSYVGKLASRGMRTKFAERFYWYIKAYQGLGKVEPTFEDLKKMLGVEKKYKDFNAFESYVLKKAKEEIEKQYKARQCDCWFTYEKVYPKGKKARGEPEKISISIFSDKKAALENKLAAMASEEQRIIAELMVKELGLSEDQAQMLVSRVTPDNYKQALSKETELKAFFDDRERSAGVKNKAMYVIKSWNNFLDGKDIIREKPATPSGNELTPLERWRRTCQDICRHLSEDEIRLTFSQVKFQSFDGGRLVLEVPNSGVRQRIEENHLPLLQKVADKHLGKIKALAYYIPAIKDGTGASR